MGLGFLRHPFDNAGRIGLDVSTLGASEYLPGGYQDQDKNTEDATGALGGVYDAYNNLHKEQGDRLTNQKAGAKGNYDPARQFLNYGYRPPTQSQDWYAEAKNRYGGTTNSQALYNQNLPSATSSQSYYNSYNPNTYLQNYSKSRSVNPYTKVSKRLDDLNKEGPGYVAGNLGDARAFAGAPTQTSGRMGERRALGDDALDERYRTRQRPVTDALDTRMEDLKRLGPDALDQRNAERSYYNQSKTRSSGVLDETQDPSRFTERTDALGETLYGTRFDKNQSDQSQRFGGRSDDTAQFLDSYDPNKTRALDSTYQTIAGQGPSYSEDFYTSQLAGDNPAYDQLQKDLERKTATSSAARGGFVAGKSLDMQRRAGAQLAADEFSRRGDLANQADQAKIARLGLRQSSASALDQQLLGQNQLKYQGAAGRDALMTDLAKSRDATGVQKAQLIADLAKFGDTQGMTLEQLRADVAKNEDMTQEQRQQAMDTIAKGISDRDAERQRQQNTVAQGLSTRDTADRSAMDTLAKGLSDRDADRQSRLDELAKSGDTTATSRYKDYLDSLDKADAYHTNEGQRGDSLANNEDVNQNTQQRDIDTLAGKSSDEIAAGAALKEKAAGDASDEYNKGVTNRQQGARDSDTSNINQGTLLGGAAKDASQEQANTNADYFKNLMGLGDADTSIDKAYDLAANGQMDDSTMAAIDARLQQAGVPAAAREALRKDLLQYGQTAIEGYRAFSGGGGGGGGGSGGGGGGGGGGGPQYHGYSIYGGDNGTPEF
jgi:hypothetical protein